MRHKYSSQIYLATSAIILIGLAALIYRNLRTLERSLRRFDAELTTAFFLLTMVVIIFLGAMTLMVLGIKKTKKQKDIRYL